MNLRTASTTLQRSLLRNFSTRVTTKADPTGSNPTIKLGPSNFIYVSKSFDPYFNLTLEDWLFRKASSDQPLLLIYRDNPCVVIGRNQNPWKEVNLEASGLRGVPWLRRRSGGGTVYHDLGNTNFSIHVPRTSFDRRATAEIVVRALRSLKVPAEVNERNDICVKGYKMSSAYKLANQRAYHHGTMLVSAQLNTLGELLRTRKDTMITKGVASVRSPVRNLKEFVDGFDHKSFVRAVVDSFRDTYGIKEDVTYADTGDVSDIPYIRDGINELKSWEWKFGQTPEFEYSITRQFEWGEAKAKIQSKHGIITSCIVECPVIDQVALKDLNKAMEGNRYGFPEEAVLEGSLVAPPTSEIKETYKWLCEEMEK